MTNVSGIREAEPSSATRRDFKARPVRRWVLWVHLGVGLGLGLMLVVVALSGSLIVFRSEIEDAMHASLTRVPPGGTWKALQPMLDGARATYPGANFHTVNLPTAPNQSVSFWGPDAQGRSFHAYANPFTGEQLGRDQADDNLTEWLYNLHANLLTGGAGERLNGLAVLLWIVLIGTGVVLWWPRKGRPWRDGFVIQWRAQWRRRNFDLHRVTGVFIALPLLLVALTGAYFPFKAPFRWLAETVTGTRAAEDSPHSQPASSSAQRVSLDEVLRVAATALPQAPPNWIHLPENPSDVYSVRFRLPGEWQLEGMNYVHVDGFTGLVVRVDRHAERTAAQRMLRAMFPLHVGTYGGLVTRVLWFLLGLTPLVLFITGSLMWYRRTFRPPTLESPQITKPSADFRLKDRR
jgi:uncharacterized iron-regulated membrane protein